MKSFFSVFLIFSAILMFSSIFGAQSYAIMGLDVLQQAAATCYAAEQDSAVETRIKNNIEMLRSRGIIPDTFEATSISFIWPLKSVNQIDPGYFGICNYFDHDIGSSNLKDYNCGQRTYDGHSGSDFCPNPFRWYKMDYNQVYVVAAAAGTIVDRVDGEYDRRCDKNIDNESNQVTILHDDGSKSYYRHLKKYSLTPKTIGDRVVAGEYLGVVGSSGRSSVPHLHFQVKNSQDQDLDPFSGSCNNVTSLWESQRPYDDSAINVLMTHTSEPVFPDCPDQEIVNKSNAFKLGDRVCFGAYYRDRLLGQKTIYAVSKPDSSLYSTWEVSYAKSYSFTSYDVQCFTIPVTESEGKWTYTANYQGKNYQHNFYVGDYTNTAPQAVISSPNNDASLASNQGNVFIGYGTDNEEGNLLGTSLVWTSSVDGVIGHGNIIFVSNLSANNHVITLSAIDEKGLRGENSISITVSDTGGGGTGSDGGGGGGGCLFDLF